MHHIASPDTSDGGIEREILAKGLTAPRVTPADLEANIASEHYFTASEGVMASISLSGTTPGYGIKDGQAAEERLPDLIPPPLDLLTFCVLVLRNGFTVVGESACASPENFDAEVGRKVARENAKQKMWPIMGYALKERLSQEKTDQV